MSRLAHLFEKFRSARGADAVAVRAEQPGIGWAVLGLGNPGEQYRASRHNIGFMAVRHLAARHDMELKRRKFNGWCGEIRLDQSSALLAMPQTFYNRSGDCASPLLGYYQLSPERLIVIHDEMDLPEHQIRLKRGGGDAGNRGIRSIAETLGTDDFIRVRIGIAHPAPGQETIAYLLQPLTSAELRGLEPALERAGQAVCAIILQGLDRAREVYNQRA